MFLSLLEFAPLRQLGRISYGAYIFHYPVIWFFLEFYSSGGSTLRPYGLSIAALLVTVAISAVSFRYLEAPLLGLKDSLFPKATRPSVVSVEETPGPDGEEPSIVPVPCAAASSPISPRP